MIKVVIIEDEAPARKKLITYLEKIDEPINIIKEIESIEETSIFLKSNPDVDLVFSDIELRDGNVFETYNQLTITCPIIFTTAYDQFWMNAFETNGIEYLLKPYSFNRFKKAWNKYTSLKNNIRVNQNDILKKLDNYISKSDSEVVYKEYIPVKTNNGIYFLKVEDIVFIQSDYGVVFAYDSTAKKHLLNQTSLKEIEKLLNPLSFFKINRSEFINKSYVERINRYTKNSVSISLKSQPHTLKTSQNNTSDFKKWLGL